MAFNVQEFPQNISKIECKLIFYFLSPTYGRESIKFKKWRFLTDLQVLRSLESKNHILAYGLFICAALSLCECACACVSVSVSVISITQKEITAQTSNLLFYIFIMHRCYFKLFQEIGQKLCV